MLGLARLEWHILSGYPSHLNKLFKGFAVFYG